MVRTTVIIDLDPDIAETLRTIGDCVHRDARDTFLEALMSITLSAFVYEEPGPLDFDTEDGIFKLGIEYFDRDPRADIVEKSMKMFVKGFKLRYDAFDDWKQSLTDLIPAQNRFDVDSVFTVEIARDCRYAKVW